jgi:cell division protein FtsB
MLSPFNPSVVSAGKRDNKDLSTSLSAQIAKLTADNEILTSENAIFKRQVSGLTSQLEEFRGYIRELLKDAAWTC